MPAEPRWAVTIVHLEPTYARHRGLPLREYRGTFLISAPDAATAEQRARGEFEAAAQRATVGWVREIVRVETQRVQDGPAADGKTARGGGGIRVTDEGRGTTVSHPTPIADALQRLRGAENENQARDRLVEVFRCVNRFVATLAVAARVQHGEGPRGGEALASVLARLRREKMTDGEWTGLARTLLDSWRDAPESHPLPSLVRLFHGRCHVQEHMNALLKLRKDGTVAHGETGTEEQARWRAEERRPALDALLAAIAPIWDEGRLALPLDDVRDGRQRALSLMGGTPHGGYWERAELGEGVRVPARELVLVDGAGKPRVALHPFASFRAPSAGAVEEVFFLEPDRRGDGARYCALPSTAERCEAGVWEVLAARLEEAGDAPTATTAGRADVASEAPFRGLRSFGPEDARWFFGRERQVDEIANLVRGSGWVTVTGASGSGKTSLLQAGVRPVLERQPEDSYRERGGPAFEVLYLRPGETPACALELSLGRLLGEVAHAGGGPEAWRDLVARRRTERGCRLVVIVDQAEELLTACRDRAERERFGELLAAIARDEAGGRVVLSVREDFFARLATVGALTDRFTRHVVVVSTPERDTLTRVLVEPARRAGFDFEPGVVERMVEGVEGQPAALALLQFVALRLWEGRDRTYRRLTVRAYEALGGVEGALARYADQVIDGLAPDERSLAWRVLLRLVSPEGTRIAAVRDEVEAAEGPAASKVIDRLVAARLLVTRQVEDGAEAGAATADQAPRSVAVVELAHEALLVHWERFKHKRAEDHEGQRLSPLLRDAAREWQRRGRRRALLWRGELLDDVRAWRRRGTTRGWTPLESAFVSASERAVVRARRIRRGGAATAFAVLAGIATVLWALWHSAQRAEQAATASARAESRQRLRAEAARLVGEAGRMRAEKRDSEAVVLLRAAARPELGAIGRDAAVRAGLRAWAKEPLALVLAGPTPYGFAWSRDGLSIAGTIAGGPIGVWSLRGNIRIAGGPPDRDASLSPDGRWYAAEARNGVAVCDPWTGATGRLIPCSDFGSEQRGLEPDPSGLIWSGDGTRIAATCADELTVWNPLTGDRLATLPWRDRFRSASQRAEYAATPPFASFHAPEPRWLGFSLSFDGRFAALQPNENDTQIWDVLTGRLLSTLHTRDDHQTVFRPHSEQLVTVSGEEVVLWNARVGRRLGELRPCWRIMGGDTYPVSAIAFSPDGESLAVGHEDGSVDMRELPHESQALSTDGCFSEWLNEDSRDGLPVWHLGFSPDGGLIAATASNKTTIWDLRRGPADRRPVVTLREDFRGHSSWSPDGRRLAIAMSSGLGVFTIPSRPARWSTTEDLDVAHVLRDTGMRTNLRPCEDTLRVVPVVPFPSPDTYFAPASACGPSSARRLGSDAPALPGRP